jgi:hypothetical protein
MPGADGNRRQWLIFLLCGRQRINQNPLISGTWTTSFNGYDGLGSVRLRRIGLRAGQAAAVDEERRLYFSIG